MGVSCVASIVGSIITGCTVGAATPVEARICGAIGAGLSGGGIQSLFRTINQKSIEDVCDFVDFISSFCWISHRRSQCRNKRWNRRRNGKK